MNATWRSVFGDGAINCVNTLLFAAAIALCGNAVAGTMTVATGGGAISADTTSAPGGSGAWTSLSGPTYLEAIKADLQVGSVVLTAPTGFEFNTAATVRVRLDDGESNANKNINKTAVGGFVATATVTATTITWDVVNQSAGNTMDQVTWLGIQVRPTAGAPLASGDIIPSGSSGIGDFSASAGTLTEVSGALNKFLVEASGGGPIGAQTQNVAFPIQVTATDKFNNTKTNFTGTVAITSSCTLSAGGGTTGAFTAGVLNPRSVTISNAGTCSITATNTAAPVVAGVSNSFAVNPTVSSFNVVEPGANAVTGKIFTKIAAQNFALDIVALDASNAISTGFTGTVAVEIVDNTSGGVCSGLPLIGAFTNQAFTVGNAGRHPLSSPNAVADVWRNAKVRVKYPAGSPTIISCSGDNFAIRPNSLSVSVTDADWQTAGVTRTLNNSGATGGNVHKAGRPFTISAIAQNAVGATTTNYNGSPTVKTLVCALPMPTCTNGILTPGAWSGSGSGTVTTSTASYNEAGTFSLTLEDQAFASVDSADSTLLQRTIPQAAAVAAGRFVPDHFDVVELITPKFQTFNVADTACSAGAAPRRTFTYIGQPFGYAITPQATIFARNAAGATTTNYSGSLWKIGGVSSSSKDCNSNPNICQFTSGWTGGGNISSVVESYAYTLTPASTPGWDNASVTTAAASIIPGSGAGIGTGTIAISSSNILAFLRNSTTPQAPFTANITNTVSVQDASEVGSPVITGNGTITTTTPLVFNGAGAGIMFDSGNEFRYGRLKLSNAYGSELLSLPIPVQAQYWNGTMFINNVADNCTTLTTNNIKLNTALAVSAAFSGVFSSGVGSLVLTAPAAKGVVDVCVDLDSGVGGDMTCQATIPAGKAYLQAKWSGANYNKDPVARAAFGVYKSNREFIYLRENY